MSLNPYRTEVLSMYHKIIRAAFTHNWNSDEDAIYVLHEARRLFRQNQFITDPETIERKLREAEMRHALAVHYSIPYPRMFHKMMGSNNLFTGAAYTPYMDSLYDSPYNPNVGRTTEGTSNFVLQGESMGGDLAPEDIGQIKR